MTPRSATPPPGSLTADRRPRISIFGKVAPELHRYLSRLGDLTALSHWDGTHRSDLLVVSAEDLQRENVPEELRKVPRLILGGEKEEQDCDVFGLENTLWVPLPLNERQLTSAVHMLLRAGELQNALTREEQLFTQSQRRLGMALKSARMGTWTRDLRTQAVDWSPELEAIYGLSPGSFPRTEQAFFELMHPDDRDKVAQVIARAMKRKEDYEVEFRYLHSSGEYRWMVGRGRGFYDTAGGLVELAGVGIDITEKKRAEQNLQERESQLRQIGDNLPDGALYQVVGDVDGSRQFVYWSAGLEKLTGVPVEEALRDPGSVYALIHPSDAPSVAHAEEKSFRERCIFDVVIRLRHRTTGEWRWVHLRSAPRILPNGSTVWDGIYADITDRKRVEDALAESMERLDLAQRAGHIGVFDWEIPNGALLWSDEEQRIFGLIPGTFEGTIEGWKRRVVPDDLDRVLTEINAAMERKEPEMGFHFRILHSSGNVRWIEGAGRFFYDANGIPVRMVGVNFDVTEREEFHQVLKEINRELQWRVTELETVTNVLPIAVAIAHDPECRTMTANRSFMELFGRNPGEGISKSGADTDQLPYRFFHDGKEVLATDLPMQRAAASGRRIHSEEYEVKMKDGRTINLLINAGPLLDEQGRPRGAVGAHVDITEAKTTERMLRDIDRRKNEFLAMLSHELRNPLAAIRNALEVSKPADVDAETFTWAKGVMDRQSAQLSRLVDDLLDVARITRGKIQLRKTRMDASSALNQAVESVASLIAERNQQLFTTYAQDGTLALDADPARLEQMVVNLLTNANKYTEVGGRIWLEARRNGDELLISVRDTGIGIPPERLPEMFEIFAQGERSIDRSEGGLGLGLTIVRSLTEMHGGAVTALSEGLGKGTEFRITLPAAETTIAPTAEIPVSRSEHDGHKARVLVVDDNVDTAHGLARLLRRKHYEVEVAYDGPAALDTATKFQPAIMLLDLGLPGMNGFELAAKLRADARFKKSLMIAVSGYGQEEDRTRSKTVGFDYHLVKPVDLQELERLMVEGVRWR